MIVVGRSFLLVDCFLLEASFPFLLTSSLLGRSFLISRAFLISVFCHPVPVAPSVFRCSFPFCPRSSLLPVSSVIALFFFECHSLLNRSFLFLLEVSVDPRFLGLSLISCFDCYASYLTAPSAEKDILQINKRVVEKTGGIDREIHI